MLVPRFHLSCTWEGPIPLEHIDFGGKGHGLFHYVSEPTRVERMAERAGQMDGARRLLARTTLEEMLKERENKKEKVLTLKKSDTVAEALEKLRKERVLSAPVVSDREDVDEKEKAQVPFAVEGILDVSTVLHALFSYMDRWKMRFDTPQEFAYCLNVVSPSFLKEEIGELQERCDDGRCIFKSQCRCSMLETVEKFFCTQSEHSGVVVKNVRHNHRILVLDMSFHPVDVVSQTDILRYLDKHTEDLGELRFKTVRELRLSKKPLGQITANIPTYEAFRRMDREKISGYAVVDPMDFTLVGNLSASDLRGLTSKTFDRLALPVGEFLTFQRPRTSLTPIICTPSTKLEDVIHTIVWLNVHRLYEVDANKRPVGVVTLTDILQCILR